MATVKQRFQALSSVHKWFVDNQYICNVKSWPEPLPMPQMEQEDLDFGGNEEWPEPVSDYVAQSPPTQTLSSTTDSTLIEQDEGVEVVLLSPSPLGSSPSPVKATVNPRRRAVVDSSDDDDEFDDCVGEGVGVVQGSPEVSADVAASNDNNNLEDSFYSCAAMPSPPRAHSPQIIVLDDEVEEQSTPESTSGECLFEESPESAKPLPFRTPRSKATRFVVDSDDDCSTSRTECSDSDSNPSLAFDLSDSDRDSVDFQEHDDSRDSVSYNDLTPRPTATPATAKRPPMCPPSTAKAKTGTKVQDTPLTVFRGKAMTKRQSVVVQSFEEFNMRVFGGQLPADLQIEWSARLRRTAGLTRSRRVGNEKSSRIELSMKVLDNEERTRRTLLHELCHVAAWLIDGELRPPHGARFWHWGKIATAKYPDLAVTRCHSYSIQFKHVYKCTNIDCGVEIGRHSKSIDTSQKVCGRCGSSLALLGNTKADGTPMKQRAATPYSIFVKEHFASIKRDNPQLNQAGVMKALADKWKTVKAASTPCRDSENVDFATTGKHADSDDGTVDLCDDDSPVPRFNLEL